MERQFHYSVKFRVVSSCMVFFCVLFTKMQLVKTSQIPPPQGAQCLRIEIPFHSKRFYFDHYKFLESLPTGTALLSPSHYRYVKYPEDATGLCILIFCNPVSSFEFWKDLPSNIKTEILSHLNWKELARVSQCSKEMYELASSEYIWKPRYLKLKTVVENVANKKIEDIIAKSTANRLRSITLFKKSEIKEKFFDLQNFNRPTSTWSSIYRIVSVLYFLQVT
jgi:hypothetical protein